MWAIKRPTSVRPYSIRTRTVSHTSRRWELPTASRLCRLAVLFFGTEPPEPQIQPIYSHRNLIKGTRVFIRERKNDETTIFIYYRRVDNDFQPNGSSRAWRG